MANRSFELNEGTWNELSMIDEVLKILSEKMDYLQTENLTMSDAYGVWVETEGRLKAMPNSPTAVQMLKQLTSRRDEYFIVNNNVMYSAIFLDPRFQLMLNENQKKEAFKHLIYLNQKVNLKKGLREPQPTAEPPSHRQEQCGNVLEQIMCQHESSQKNIRVPQTNCTNDDLQIELENFSRISRSHAETNIRSFWKTKKFEYPILYELSQIVFAVPPTEVAVERNFSALDFILTKRRNRLSDRNLEIILFLKLNSKLLIESFEKNELIFE